MAEVKQNAQGKSKKGATMLYYKGVNLFNLLPHPPNTKSIEGRASLLHSQFQSITFCDNKFIAFHQDDALLCHTIQTEHVHGH